MSIKPNISNEQKMTKNISIPADDEKPECGRRVRVAVAEDLDFLDKLEQESFVGHRRSARRNLKNSITSANQVVYVAEELQSDGGFTRAGSATVIVYKRAVRLYSIAVHSDFRKQGFGELLIHEVIDQALQDGYEKISLEADQSDAPLIEWYRKFGFEITHFLPNYYGIGDPACRMTLIPAGVEGLSERAVVVTEDDFNIDLSVPGIKFCSAGEYLSEKKYSSSTRFHVLNFCRSYKTHSMGYYVSLLALARNHRITPSVMSVKDVSNRSIAQSIFEELGDFADKRLKQISGNSFELTVILGKTPHPHYAGLAKKLFSLFEIPFFSIALERKASWEVKRITTLPFKTILENHSDLLKTALIAFCEKKRYYHAQLKNYKYDLAILVNPSETTPPSCAEALKKFQKAAEKTGFFVEFVTKQDQRRLCEFDALFIRETTAIESHTYAMARHAYTEGLVVIDDPWSILLCSNKVYLHERLSNAGVPQPKGFVLTKRMCTPAYLAQLPLPLVLKLPESSFSQGVFLVKSIKKLQERLTSMFAGSALVIAQEFMKSDYDWRIGVIDNTPLFACKYYMASGHWQIYNWHSEADGEFSGRFETLPIDQVPSFVLKAALKATALIGNGLYGVDVKEVSGKAYVIEVNDNPNIDADVEDQVLGDEIYNRIMQSIFNRIEVERLQKRSLI